jgi:hypothetical protein
MNEIICNLHIHSRYSDGTGSYNDILDAAAATGVDVVIVTDHNIRVEGVDGYYERSGKQVLLLVGEEIHDQSRFPQKNHMLVFGAGKELAPLASDPQKLIDRVNELGGSAFIAHPDEFALPMFGEDDISWENWDVRGFTGFEIWNGMSEFKTVSRTTWQVLKHGFFPELVAHRPLEKSLQRWDKFLAEGRKLSVVGGTDSHALHIKIGPFTKVIYPYKFHFSTINNHLLLTEGLNGDLDHDRKLVLVALKTGSSFVGYDLPAPTRGFSFRIDCDEDQAWSGQTASMHRSGILHVKTPMATELNVLHDGEVIFHSDRLDNLSLPVNKPGAYRVECYAYFLGERRGWIFSNPIYLSKRAAPDDNRK